jgi:hypothetical protein
VGQYFFDQPFLIVRGAEVIKSVRFPMWEERIVVCLIRAEFTPVKPIVQIPRSQLSRKFNSIIGGA